MKILDVYNPTQSIPVDLNSNEYSSTTTLFEKTGYVGVPFIKWRKYKEKDEIGVEHTIGNITITKSKVQASGLDQDSRLKYDGKFYIILNIKPSVGQIYVIEFEEIQDSIGTVTYESG